MVGLVSCRIVLAFEGNLHFSLFENIGDFPDVWCVGEGSPFCVTIL